LEKAPRLHQNAFGQFLVDFRPLRRYRLFGYDSSESLHDGGPDQWKKQPPEHDGSEPLQKGRRKSGNTHLEKYLAEGATPMTPALPHRQRQPLVPAERP